MGPSRGHVRVSHRRAPNFLERVGNSMVGSVVGVFVVLGACCLLFWNEGRSVRTYEMLVEAGDLCNPLRSPDNVYDNLNNKLVYLSGKLATAEPLEDRLFGVPQSAVRLRRKVEMYQWVEETETREYNEPDGSIRKETIYNYFTEWKNYVVDSNSFDDRRYHDNPKTMPVEKMELTAESVTVGLFTLSREAVLKISNWKRLPLNPSTSYGSDTRAYDNTLYHSDSSFRNPQVGDVRVWFEYAGSTELGREDEVSVVAQQSPGPVLTSFRAPSGYDILFLYMNRLSMNEVFEREHASNKLLTWVLRGVGWLIVFVGLNMIANIVVTLFDWLPLLGGLLAFSTMILAVILATSISLLVTAVAWIFFRPLYALAILFGACLPLILPRLHDILWSKPKNG